MAQSRTRLKIPKLPKLPKFKFPWPARKLNFHLMPYPVFKTVIPKSGRSLQFNDFMLKNGQKQQKKVITAQDLGPREAHNGAITVGTHYSFGPPPPPPPSAPPKKRETIFNNGRYGRGIQFKASPKEQSSLDSLLGKWIPGRIPGEYNWKGMQSNPMKDNNIIGENVIYHN
jgi:hypothetical protein